MKFLFKRDIFVSLMGFISFSSGFNIDRNNNLSDIQSAHNSTLQCDLIPPSFPDVDLTSLFPTFDFNSSWISHKYFWQSEDFDFEARHRAHFSNIFRGHDNLIRVIVLPHSHNDPGWLNTYEQYYYRQTRYILDNAVRYLTEFPEMTFVWSEITYLARWWKDASPEVKEQFRKLVVDEKRLEIATGGWVVPDEACSSLYSLAQELTEGQQWVYNNLGIMPKYSWAIDPFGHSSTHSHLLSQSNLRGMVIQRLHYVWKHWLAQHKTEEFRWRPRWGTSGEFDIPCLTLPYDLYSIKHACGPQPQVCLKFDFRSVPYEYGENYGLMTPISKVNLRKSAQELTAQYTKTASLTKHNVVLVPLGDDFRYDRSLEWQQQYTNYMQLFSHINSNQDKYRIEIGFGTLSQYFETVDQEYQKRNEQRPSLSGDFFPYGDVYVSGKPSYWTGFYGTRPYWKRLHREVENELRSAEILFTYANAIAKQTYSIVEMKILSYKYSELITSRHDFAIFAHHDGITGTSKRWTMEDYGDRLYMALRACIDLQIQCLKIIRKNVMKTALPVGISKDYMRERFEVLPTKVPLEVFGLEDQYATNIMVFNNLGWKRKQLIRLLVKSKAVKVVDLKGARIPSQINPVFSRDDSAHTIHISDRAFELVFLADLEPLSISTFQIMGSSSNTDDEDEDTLSTLASVVCNTCANLNETSFGTVDASQSEDRMIIENAQTKLHFQENGLLERVEMKGENESVPVKLSYGFYRPVNKDSGAYLLKPALSTEFKFFGDDNSSHIGVIKMTGPIMSQVVAIHHSHYETLIANTTLLIGEDETTPIHRVLLENYVDLSRDYSRRLEVFMRFDTNLNSANANLTKGEFPVMYTDQNGLVSEKRTHIPEINYEGNTYPVTTMAHIQDEGRSNQNQSQLRFSVLVDRTHGFTSMKVGRMETLIDRRSLYDDARGMSEGVSDSKPTVSSYHLLLESLEGRRENEEEEIKGDPFPSWQPTLPAQRSTLKLNYPPNVFVYADGNNNDDKKRDGLQTQDISLIASPLPDNVHLFNLRTLSEEIPRYPPNVFVYADGNNNDDKKRDGLQTQDISLIASPLPDNVHLFNLRTLSEEIPRNFDPDSSQVIEEKAGMKALLNLQYLYGYEPIGYRNCKKDESAPPETEAALPILQVRLVKVTKVEGTSLTGVGRRIGDEQGMNSTRTSRGKSLLNSFNLFFR